MIKRYLHNANSSKVSDRAIRCSNRCWTDILGCTNRSWLDPLGCSNRCWIDRSIKMLNKYWGPGHSGLNPRGINKWESRIKKKKVTKKDLQRFHNWWIIRWEEDHLKALSLSSVAVLVSEMENLKVNRLNMINRMPRGRMWGDHRTVKTFIAKISKYT